MPPLDSADVLARVAEVIASRRGGDPDKSYVARLFHKGTDTILKKVGEEATEVVRPVGRRRGGRAGAPRRPVRSAGVCPAPPAAGALIRTGPSFHFSTHTPQP